MWQLFIANCCTFMFYISSFCGIVITSLISPFHFHFDFSSYHASFFYWASLLSLIVWQSCTLLSVIFSLTSQFIWSAITEMWLGKGKDKGLQTLHFPYFISSKSVTLSSKPLFPNFIDLSTYITLHFNMPHVINMLPTANFHSLLYKWH